jgi:hypothetical protein
MTRSFESAGADDLVRLWQQSLLPSTDPNQLARELGRMTLRRFDRAIGWRNFREYAGAVAALAFGGLQWAFGGDRIQVILLVAGVGVSMGWLWWQHRRLEPLDPAADARAYQTAMLARLDQQIRLLSRVRYWYLLPLYLPAVRQTMVTWPSRPVGAVILLAIVTVIFAGIGWLNERVAVAFLKAERVRIESLYEDAEG